MKPPIWWYGGKSMMVNDILPYVPTHECYVEPYGGAAAVLFAKEPSKVEIYNDLHEGVVNLYRVLRSDLWEALAFWLELTPYSRSELEYAWDVVSKHSVEEAGSLAHARCFFTVARQSFAARTDAKPGWSSSKINNKAGAWFNSIAGLPEVHKRLKNVQVECKPAIEVIKKYDGRNTFIYLDPPYMSETRKEANAYKYEMTDNQHLDLIACIKRVKSMVLLSGYHSELYDNLLGAWYYKDTGVSAPAPRGDNIDRYRVEVLWWNDALEVNRVGAQQLLDLEVWQ